MNSKKPWWERLDGDLFEDHFAKDEEGRTALFAMAAQGDMKGVKEIIFSLSGTGVGPQRRALIEVKDRQGQTASDVAREAGHSDIAELLDRERIRMEYYE